ncbi:hypothetical protein SNE40_008896 [Patella caerulea]|uniref:Uncharacterized protein n=1 Tax=Patella caerulea TaxID=87958 RepID=A0AAN8JMT8_PATCE
MNHTYTQIMVPAPERPPDNLQTYLLLFDKGSGSPRVNYFMIDPSAPSLILPKMNTIIFKRLGNISGYKTAVVNNCLYVIGGKDWTTGDYLTSVRKFNPMTNKWSEQSPIKTPRCRFTATVLDGFIYIVGGESLRGRVTESVERYDPKKNIWMDQAPIPRPRADHATCALNGRLYVSGGISNLRHNCSNVFWMYDPVENTWCEPLEGIALPQERDKHNMVAVGITKIFILGGRGFDNETISEKDENQVSNYNIDGFEFSDKPVWDNEHQDMKHPRSNAAAVRLGRNIWMIGGKSSVNGEEVKMVEYYDTNRRRWSEAFPLNGGNLANLEYCILKIPTNNKEFECIDNLMYDKWILW